MASHLDPAADRNGSTERSAWSIRTPLRAALALIMVVAVAVPAALAATTPKTVRTSVSSSGVQGNGPSYTTTGAVFSADDRFVAFYSTATNLGCTNGKDQIILRNLKTHTTKCVSRSSSGAEANTNSLNPSISADGRFVAFDSSATNLGGCTNGDSQIFVRDLQTHKTRCVSLHGSGVQGNGNSSNPSISADGRFVAFQSAATNLTSACTGPMAENVFVRDLKTNKTRCASLSTSGAQGNANSNFPWISASGRFVAFTSPATNLGCTNGKFQVIVRDLKTHKTRCVSRSSTGAQGNGNSAEYSINADGRFVAFQSQATNLGSCPNGVDQIFVRDLNTGKTRCASRNSSGAQGNNESELPSLSSDGRFVAFGSVATNLVSGDTNMEEDIFVRDLKTNKTRRVSVNSSRAQANGGSFEPSISADGRFVAFESSATNLVPHDTNGTVDVFVRGPLR